MTGSKARLRAMQEQHQKEKGDTILLVNPAHSVTLAQEQNGNHVSLSYAPTVQDRDTIPSILTAQDRAEPRNEYTDAMPARFIFLARRSTLPQLCLYVAVVENC